MSGSRPAADPSIAPEPEAMPRVGRRRWLAGVIAAALAPILGTGRRAVATETLGYGCGPGCDDSAALAELERIAGASLALERLGADESALEKLGRSDGSIDFFLADSTLIERAAAQGLARPLTDAASGRIGGQLLPPLRPPFGPLLHAGLGIALPVRWGWIGPVLDATADARGEWKDHSPLFDPKHRGHIGALANGPWLPLLLMHHAGVDPFAPIDEDGEREFVRVLRAFLKNEPVLLDNREAAATALGDGALAAVVGAGSQFAAILRRSTGRDWRAVVLGPRDGMKQTLLWVEAAGVHAASDAPELAAAALAALFEPAVARALSLAADGPAPSASETIASGYSAEERRLLQLEDAEAAWQRGRLRRPVPDLANLQAIWKQERANAG
jgi:hypothetical protein